MKLLDLRLQAVGPFSSQSIVFDKVARLHVIYGPNEAGKSSALRALQALLFGFPNVTTEAFVHSLADLRVGARIAWNSGAETVLVRRKGRDKTLLDEANAPLAADPLAVAVAGLDAASWRQGFGIDHTSLRVGGAQLLKNEGGVGDTLFTAATGGPHVKGVMEGLAKQADKLFLGRNASKPTYNAAKSALAEAERRVRDASASAATVRERERERTKQRAERERVEQAIRTRQAEVRRCARLRRARPRIAERADLVAALHAGGNHLDLPVTFAADVARLRAEWHVARAARDSSSAELGTLTAALAALPPPSGLHAAAERIGELHQRVGGMRADAARVLKIRPHRQSHSDALRTALHAIEPGLREEDVAARWPTQVQVAEVDRLIEGHAAHMATLQGAEVLVERWQSEAARLAALPTVAAGDVEDRLEPALTAARAHGDLAQRCAKADAALAAATARTHGSVAGLHPWQGTPVHAAALPVPQAATVEAAARSWEQHAADGVRLRERRRERDDHGRAARAAVESYDLAGDVPTETALHDARAARDGAIAQLAAVATGTESAPADAAQLVAVVAAAVAAADAVADRLHREANRVTEYARAKAELHRADADLAAQARDEARHEAVTAQREAEWRALWAPVGIAPRPPREMTAWLATHAQVAALVETATMAQHEAEAAHALLDMHRGALAHALQACGDATDPAESLAALIVRCERRLATARKARADDDARCQQVVAAQREADDAQSRLDAARRRMSEWATQWAAALASLGRPATTTPQTARLVLGLLGEARANQLQIQELDKQLAGIERDAEAFRTDVVAVERDLGASSAEADPTERVRILQHRCHAAQQVESQRQDVSTRCDAARATLALASDRLSAAESGLADACKRAGCVESADLDAAILAADTRRRSLARIAELERDLVQDGEGRSLDECMADALAADADKLAADQAAAEGELAPLDAERTRIVTRLAELQVELGAIDGSQRAADADADAQAALATMRAAAEQWAVIKLAEWLLRAEVARYRERAQGPVMRRASEFLARLTRGSIARLEVDDSSEPASLVGVRSSGKRVRVPEMSEGTCDQLFLALRLASIEHAQKERSEPLPIVLDDVLLAFDDDRAAVTLDVLADLGESVQVLLFTHQRSVVAAARQLGARVAVRELGGAGAQG